MGLRESTRNAEKFTTVGSVTPPVLEKARGGNGKWIPGRFGTYEEQVTEQEF